MIAGTLLVFVASAWLLDRHGKQSRRYVGPAQTVAAPALPVTVVETSDALYRLYRSRNVRGRLLVHVGRYLHAVDIDAAEVIPAQPDGRYPLSVSDMLPLYEKRISYRNVLWVAEEANMVREIMYYQPPGMFRNRLEAMDDRDPDLLSKSSDALVFHDWGARRTISDRMPRLHEPVLLNIDASVFDELRPEQVLNALRSSSLTSDLVTLNLSLDNPDVTASSRRDLLLFAKMLGKEALH